MKKILGILLAVALSFVLADIASAQFSRRAMPMRPPVATHNDSHASTTRQLPVDAKVFEIKTTNLEEWANILGTTDQIVPLNAPATMYWDNLNVVVSYLDPSGQIKIRMFKVSDNDSSRVQSTIRTNNCRQASEILQAIGRTVPKNAYMSVLTSGKTAVVSYIDGNEKLQMKKFPLVNEGETRITQIMPKVPSLSGINFIQTQNAGKPASSTARGNLQMKSNPAVPTCELEPSPTVAPSATAPTEAEACPFEEEVEEF